MTSRGCSNRGRKAHQLIHGKKADDSLWHVWQGYVCAKLGQTKRSEAEFAVAVADSPLDPAVWFFRSLAFDRLGMSDRAGEDLLKSQGLKCNDAVTAVGIGRQLATCGETEMANRALTRAAELAPDEPSRFLQAGWWVAGPYPRNPSDSQLTPVDPDPSKPVVSTSGTSLRWQPRLSGVTSRSRSRPASSGQRCGLTL